MEKQTESIIIEDENGNEETYNVDAVIEMNEQEYVIYSVGKELSMKRIEQENGEDVLLNVSEEEAESLVDAYEEALEEDLEED